MNIGYRSTAVICLLDVQVLLSRLEPDKPDITAVQYGKTLTMDGFIECLHFLLSEPNFGKPRHQFNPVC